MVVGAAARWLHTPAFRVPAAGGRYPLVEFRRVSPAEPGVVNPFSKNLAAIAGEIYMADRRLVIRILILAAAYAALFL